MRQSAMDQSAVVADEHGAMPTGHDDCPPCPDEHRLISDVKESNQGESWPTNQIAD